jgi:YVTN family beta-propeller protein
MKQAIVPVLMLAALASGQWLETVIELSNPSALCYGPINNKVYCSSTTSGALVVIDGATNQRIVTIPDAGGVSLLYNPASNVIYSGMYWDSAIAVVDGASNLVIARPHISGTPKAMCYAPGGYEDAHVAVACDLAHKVVIMDAQQHIAVAELDVGSGPQSMCWDQSMDRLFCANKWDSTVTTTRGDFGRDIWFVEALLNVGRYPDGLCFDSTDDKAYCGTDDQGVAVIKTSLEVTHVVTGHRSTPACYDPRQNMVYCTDADSPTGSTMTVIDCSADTVAATVAVGNQPGLAYYNAINNKVYCVNYKSCDVSVIDASTNEVVVTIPIDSNPQAICWNTAQNRTYVSCAPLGSYGRIYVLRDSMPSGVEESPKPQASSYKPEPTVLFGASSIKRLASSVIFDAMGRRVANPKSGVYFVTERDARSTVHARKIVIQR